MSLLETDGFLVRLENQGYFVADADAAAMNEALDAQPVSTDGEYHRLADDWLMNRLPKDVTDWVDGRRRLEARRRRGSIPKTGQGIGR